MRKSFLTILGLLVTVIIIVFLSYFLLNAYLFKQPATAQRVLPENVQGTAQYKTIIDDARNLTNDINKQIRQQQEQIDEILR